MSESNGRSRVIRLQKTRPLERRQSLSNHQLSKKKSSKSDDLEVLDNKWSQRFAELETMLLAKSFSVLVLAGEADVYHGDH